MNGSGTPKRKVLYIEASDLIPTWVRPLLARLGCQIELARNTDDARAIIEQENPPCFLSLVLLGDLSRPRDLVAGVPLAELSLIRSIRDRKRYLHTPIIIFTNINWLTDAYAHGADGHVLKPAGSDELETVIRPYLEGKKKREQHAANSRGT